MFKPVEAFPHFPEIEERVLVFWKKNNIFEKSVTSRPEDKQWTFLDGPPFVTGSPHYGSLLSSLPKDLFGRYWTMKGYRVRRVWGWDGHGLPIENKVENALGIKRKKDIEEKVGIKKFIEECQKYVNDVSADWEWYVDHIGRWVDFKNAYKTWSTDYMESVMWVFKQMHDKEYIYKGLRVTTYCPHCATPISNFETALDNSYKEVPDATTTYKYKLEGEKSVFILAWSTTPWNKIVTPALAVNPKLVYVKVRQGDESYILAEAALKELNGESETLEKFKGKTLVGKKFEPHYDYYAKTAKGKLFEIIGGDFVTADEGTGVVTIAAYGEEDLKAMKENGIHIETHLDEEGTIKPEVPLFGGMYYLKANKAVNADLSSRNLIYKDEILLHNVPICWRCQTRLYYAPINAWFIDVQKLKPAMKKTNESINWYPSHFKYGRFLKSMENAPDWNISRNRYWGSPVPVWECKCGERFVPGSINELEKASGRKIQNLHKPEIDSITVECRKCKKQAQRTPEVLDSWIEAGSASFAERHFPFNKEWKLENFFPPDFIAEYTGQIRAWFYVLHVIGTALYDAPAFKNVLVEGVIQGTDGRKMSKNFKNYPDPKEMLQKYGGDALRLYLMSSPVMKGEDILISEEHYRNQVRGFMLILWNVYNFFITYARLHNFTPTAPIKKKYVLDRWIISLLQNLIEDVGQALDSYNTVAAIQHIDNFVQNLSTWYVRRSRERVAPYMEGEDREACLATLYEVLTTVVIISAPITPFISEEIFKNLTSKESVHLEFWPVVNSNLKDQNLEKQMEEARDLITKAHSHRKEKGVKLRQPLAHLISETKNALDAEVVNLIKQEVNVKKVDNKQGKTTQVLNLDTVISPGLQSEGEAREIVRKIQVERKKIGARPDEKVIVNLSSWPKDFEEEIKRKALVETLNKSELFKVIKKG